MDLKNISTEELARELATRKENELPEIVEKVNQGLRTIKALIKEIVYHSDPSFVLNELYIEDGEVRYKDVER